MILLEIALQGRLSSGPPLSDTVRHLLADAALHCLAISGGMFFVHQDAEQSDVAITALTRDGVQSAAHMLAQHEQPWPIWIKHLLGAMQSLHRVVELYHQEDHADAVPSMEALIQLLLTAAQVNLLALQNHARAATTVHAELELWVNIHTSHGMLHSSILARALASQIYRKAQDMPPEEAVRLYEEAAYQVLDRADEINQARRHSEYYSDMLIAAHLTLPMYSTALSLLESAREQRRAAQIEVTEDLIKEIGVTEEYRVACMETLSLAGILQIDQVINTAALHAQRGELFGPVLLANARDVSARIPHYPVRLRKAWQQLAEEVDTIGPRPYSSTQSLRLMAMLAYAMQERLKELFTDSHTVTMTILHQRSSGFPLYSVYYTPPVEHTSRLHPLPSDAETQREEEAQAAFEIATRLRSQGETSRAINAYMTVHQLKHEEYSLLAALHLAQMLQEQGRRSEIEPFLREVVAAEHSEYTPYAATWLGTLLAEQESPEAEQVLQQAIACEHPEHSPHAAFNLALIKYRRAELDQAASILSDALRYHDASHAPLAADLLGHIRLDQGNLQEAADIFRSIATRSDPAARTVDPAISEKAWVNLGYALYHLGDTSGAEAAFLEATAAVDQEVVAVAQRYLDALRSIGQPEHSGNESAS